MRLLVPGSLCDQRLYDSLCDRWTTSEPPGITRCANLHTLDIDPTKWWQSQLIDSPETFDVIGFSLGGVLAFDLLCRMPQRVRSLVLIAANPMAGSLQHQQRGSEQQQLWDQHGPAAVIGQTLDQCYGQRPIEPVMRQTIEQMALDTPRAAFLAQSVVNASRPNGLPALARWHGKLLIISGQLDPWCGSDKQLMMTQCRPDALWHEITACGHYLPLECPDKIAALIKDFFHSQPD